MSEKTIQMICFGLVWFNPLQCFFGSEGHVALDRNPGPGYDTLLLRMMSGDLLSAFPQRQFHTLPGLLDSWAALPNSNPNHMHAYAGRQSVPFLWWSLVWPGREANSRPTVWEADTLPTEPTGHGQMICKVNIIRSEMGIIMHDVMNE